VFKMRCRSGRFLRRRRQRNTIRYDLRERQAPLADQAIAG
jgi:hypothetical protein